MCVALYACALAGLGYFMCALEHRALPYADCLRPCRAIGVVSSPAGQGYS